MKKYISIIMAICLAIGAMGVFTVSAADPIDPIQLILVDVLSWDAAARLDFNNTILKPIDNRTPTSADVATLAPLAEAKIEANSSFQPVKDLTVGEIESALAAFKAAGTSFDVIGNEHTSASGNSVKQIYTAREMLLGYENIPEAFATANADVATAFPAVAAVINEKLTGDAANNNGVFFATLYLRELAYLNRKLGGPSITDTYVSMYYTVESRFDFKMNPLLDRANKKLIVQASNDLLNMLPTFAASLSAYEIDSSVSGLVNDADNITGKFMTFTETMLNDDAISAAEKANFANFLDGVKRFDAIDDMDHIIIHIIGDKVPDVIATKEGLVDKNTLVHLSVEYDFPYDVIYYTLDGSDPSDESNPSRQVYDHDAGIIITEDMTIRAYAVKALYEQGDVSDFDYEIRTTGNGGNFLPSTPPPVLITDDHFAYMQGYPDKTFRAEANMTRAEATVMFSRLLVEKMNVYETYENSFADIKGDEWYAQSVAYMVNKGYIKGDPNGNFRPDDHITRAEFAVLASRFDRLAENSDVNFSDIEHGYWAASYIGSAATKGWVTGYPDGTFRPENAIARSEVVTVTNRMLGRVADKAFIDASADIVHFIDLETSYWAYYDIMESANGHDFEITDIEKWTKLR